MNIFTKKKKYIFLFIFLIIFNTCCYASNQKKNIKIQKKNYIINNSFEFFKNTQYNSWFTDIKTYNIGDCITVQLNEKNILKKNKIFKHTNTNYQETKPNFFFTYMINLFFNQFSKLKNEKNVVNQNNIIHKLTYITTSKLFGKISTIIKKILPNGFLQIYGKKEIKFNNKIEKIFLKAIIDPKKIKRNNEILSTDLINAKIKFYDNTKNFSLYYINIFKKILKNIFY